MYKKSLYAAAYCLFSFLVVGLSYAEEKTELTDLRLILTGNTVEGKNIKTGMNYKMYFHPSGKLVRVNAKAAAEKGDWRISEKEELCIRFASEKCHTVKKRGEGQFDLHNPGGERMLTIEKVILGNPNKYNALSSTS